LALCEEPRLHRSATTIDGIGTRELLEERRSLLAVTGRMERSICRAADWLIGRFAPQGPIMGKRDLSYCHKVTWGLYEAGRLDAVRQLLDWIATNARIGPGRYYFPEEPPFNKDMQRLYRLLTFAQVAERLKHPALANKETRKEIMAHQHSSGGAFANIDDPEYMQTINPLVTSFFAEWALAADLKGPAKRSADFLARMVEGNASHMNAQPGRFCYNYDAATDSLVTEPEPSEEINCFVDTVKPRQHFYQIGTAMAALADVYAATGTARYLDCALKLAEFEARLNPVGLRWPSYCKIGWGAAELYAITGLPAHRAAAANVSEVTFMGAQTQEGGWERMFYPMKDHGAWESISYDGSGRVPSGIEEDGSWGILSAEEITGEFTAEMARTLSAFKDALSQIEERLQSFGFNRASSAVARPTQAR